MQSLIRQSTKIRMTMQFFDVAVNLGDAQFTRAIYNGRHDRPPAHRPDLVAVLGRAHSTGVDRALICAGSLQESREALKMARARSIGAFMAAAFGETDADQPDGIADQSGFLDSHIRISY